MKKKMEFSKKLVVWSLVITSVSLVAAFVLAAFGCDGFQEFTMTTVRACTAIAAGYLTKSYGEKASRNKYGLDEDGIPFDLDFDGATETETEEEEAVG